MELGKEMVITKIGAYSPIELESPRGISVAAPVPTEILLTQLFGAFKVKKSVLLDFQTGKT